MTNNELKIVVSNSHQQECIFKKVAASQLSLRDEFLNYTPRTENEKTFMKEVKKVIKEGVPDFWRPIYDPSIDDYGRIVYKPGNMPAVGIPYSLWSKLAKGFYPDGGSRLGTKAEYISFLAVLIKELVDSGEPVRWAWDAVCNDSRELGHYENSRNAKPKFEPTGKRENCGWYDLANTIKLLKAHRYYCVAGGAYDLTGDECPLSEVRDAYKPMINALDEVAAWTCGWIVLERCPDC